MKKINKNVKIVIIIVVIFIISIIYYFGFIKNKKEIEISKDTEEVLSTEDKNEILEKESKENVSIKNENAKEKKEENKTNKIIVHIEGEVNKPGVYELDKESRIINVVELARRVKRYS